MPVCNHPMELKGEVDASSENETVAIYQCPNCKNIQVYKKQYESYFRMEYP